jgi:exodeoxyribonuclease V beta subunit
VEPRDVFILTRTRAEGVEIATYLREVGVPYAFYKRDGLFQTAEAGDLLEVLRAIEDPLDRSRRLKAWNTPLFVVPYEELASADGAGADHELTARLWEWKELARRERFSDLFDALMTQSGLAFRELLFSDSERELTNYQHILEILLEQALVRRLSLAEIIELLSSYAAERAAPPGDDSNVERLESERKAVQIMTVHLSKGLEADVVILYGGFGGFRDRSIAAAYHDRATTERLVALGKDAKSQVEDIIKRERADEDRRLAYVALTRARVKLFLPFLTEGVSKRSPQSYYRFINQRLTSIAGDADAGKPWRHLFESVAVARPDGSPARQDLRDALASFNPPPNLLTIDTSMDDALRRLSAQRRALEVLSYTALERLGAGESAVEIEDFKIDPAPEGAAPTEDDQLRGGRNVGLFLHEAIERTDVAALAAARDFSEWSARPQAGEVIDSAMRRHQVLDGRWRNAGMEMVFNALRSPIGAGGVVIEDIASCELSREMEFVFPIPERTHPLLTQAADADWRIERGVLIGFVDIVFRHKGKTYFADWKSDRLMNYEPESVRSHVEINYALQAKIYTLGVVRLLGIRDQAAYEARFGGLLYIFLRGIVPDGGGARGIYFHRPRWDEVVSIEAELMNPRAAAALGGS